MSEDGHILNDKHCQNSSCYSCNTCSNDYPKLSCFNNRCFHCDLMVSKTRGYFMRAEEDKNFIFCNENCYKNYLILNAPEGTKYTRFDIMDI